MWPDEERRVQGSPTAICFARVTFIFRSMKKKKKKSTFFVLRRCTAVMKHSGRKVLRDFIYLFIFTTPASKMNNFSKEPLHVCMQSWFQVAKRKM